MTRYEWLAPLAVEWRGDGDTFGGPAYRFGLAFVAEKDFVKLLRDFWRGRPDHSTIGPTVEKRRESPYRFATRLRDMVGDPDAPVMCYPFSEGPVYWCRSGDTLAVYLVDYGGGIPVGFPATIARHRTAAGLSVSDLARKSGLSDDAIRRYESGDRSPTWDAVQKLAAALGVPTDAFRETRSE